jgi:small subunit ribosomal protein S19
MSRSIKKGPDIDLKLIKKVKERKAQGSHEPIRTWARASTIPPDFVSMNFLVHNGKSFIKVFITEDMVGHKLGEFAATRMFRGHTGRKQK